MESKFYHREEGGCKQERAVLVTLQVILGIEENAFDLLLRSFGAYVWTMYCNWHRCRPGTARVPSMYFYVLGYVGSVLEKSCDFRSCGPAPVLRYVRWEYWCLWWYNFHRVILTTVWFWNTQNTDMTLSWVLPSRDLFNTFNKLCCYCVLHCHFRKTLKFILPYCK